MTPNPFNLEPVISPPTTQALPVLELIRRGLEDHPVMETEEAFQVHGLPDEILDDAPGFTRPPED